MTKPDGKLRLYFDFLSQPSRALYILLKVSGTTFEEHLVDLMTGEHMTEEYKEQANHFQKVPAIIDGNFKLAESVAILRYLAQNHYISKHLYPSEDICKRARVDEFLEWQHNGIRSSCSLYFRFAWVEARFFGAPAAAGKVFKYRKAMESDLEVMERLWLKDTKYLTGNTLTAADVFGACEVEQIRVTGYNVREKFPKTANWIEAVRVALRPHFDVAHQTVYKHERETKAKL